MSEREDLEQAIAVIEAQRPSLSDAAVDSVLAGLRRRLAELGEGQSERSEGAGKPASSSERRIITVLFADVKDSTAMADKLDPETWTEIMDRAYKLLIDPVDRFGGTVAQLIGDAVVAFFGAPTAHEDDPQRASEAGLEILENISDFREELAHRYGLDFNVRVGINTGLAVAGRIGSQAHKEYTALGDAVNLAARMEQTAEPGTIQITDNTYRLVASLFDCMPLGGIDVKGKSEPVAAYRVVGHKTEVGPLRGLSSYGVASPYIGRAAELATAKNAFESVLAGRGHILMIIGEAGIGKSRLLAELRRHYQTEDITWLNGRTLSFGQEIGYLPFQDILRQFSGIHEEDGEAEAWRKLESSVQNLLPQESPDILPYLAGLMALEARGKYAERVKYLDGDAMREQISLASRRFFKQLASEQPLVLVFEDLHWIDASSVRLLESLLPLSEQTSLLFCFVTRPDPNPAAEKLRRSAREAYGERFSEIRLAPLTRADSAQLVRALLEDDDLSTRARDVIVNKADGNPFFLEEIIRNLIETGAITQHTENGRWQATSRIDMIDIPDTIQGVITARIDRFDERVKRVLRSAAVIGHSFYLRVLGAVLETEPDLDQQLSTLQMAELIREKQRLPELEYIFKHALAQDVAYSSILLQTRRDLHARVGHAIEHLFEDRLEEFYSLLAYHYAQAQAWETAQDYLLKAGDQAVQVAADAEALAHYQRALKAYENAFGSDWDPLQRARLARKMGEAHYGLGQLPESRDYFQDALALLGKPLPKSRSGLLAGLAGQVLRQALHRLLPSRFVNSVRGEKREALREMVRAYERLGVIFYIEGQAASSVYAFLRSLNLAEPAGPSPELARAYANNVVAASLIPPLRFMADQYSKLAIETADSGDDLAARAWVWQMTGIYNTGIGRWPVAIKAEEEAVELNQRIGRLRWWEESMGTLAQALHLQGDFARSREKYQALYISSYERGDQQTLFWALAGLIETGLRLGGPDYLDELTGYIEEAQAALNAYRHPNRPDQIQFTGALAQVRLRRKEWALAEEAAAAAGDLIAAEQPPSTFYTMEAYAGIPVVYLGLWEAAKRGQYSKGREESFKKLAGQACRSLHGYARVFPIAEPRAWLWQGVYDWRDGRPSKARQAWQKSADGARRLAMPYDLALAELEIGRHLAMDDPQRGDYLERAARRFAELGAAWDLQRVEGKEQGKESKGTQ